MYHEGAEMVNPTVNADKAIEVLLYVAARVPNMYHALKVLYFADRLHLERYGRLIYGDSYVAMDKGPVPSAAYDMVKCARGDGFYYLAPEIREALGVRDHILLPKREPDPEYLSASDIECLDQAVATYGRMSFGPLMELSHDAAYKSADQNDFISFEALVHSLPDGEELLAYLNDC